MRMKHGFTYNRGQRSPSIEPNYDDDDAWRGLRDIPTETIQVIEPTDSVPGSSVDAMGEPQGDQHITTSSSLVVEASDDAPASTTMSTSTAMVVGETPSAMHGTNRTNPQPKATLTARLIARSRMQRDNNVLMDEARQEIDSLRKELASAQHHSSQVLQLLEEDSDAHPSNRQARADRAALTKATRELSELHAAHWIAEKELERAKNINDKTIVENLALHRSITDWKGSTWNSTIMETQRVDLGTYKTSLGRLEDKYNDVVAELDEANNEIVEAESATTKAEAERNRIQLLFNDSTGSGQLLQRERDVNRAEAE